MNKWNKFFLLYIILKAVKIFKSILNLILLMIDHVDYKHFF